MGIRTIEETSPQRRGTSDYEFGGAVRDPYRSFLLIERNYDDIGYLLLEDGVSRIIL